MRILITGACGVTPRAIARSIRMSPLLGAATLVGSDVGGNLYPLYEGLYERIHFCPHSRDPEYRPFMLELMEREHVDVAVIAPELEVRHWAADPPPVPALLPPPGFAEVAINKATVYERLRGTGLVPDFAIVSRDDLMMGSAPLAAGWPLWVRDYEPGSSSGKGALLAQSDEEARAWVTLNAGIGSFMVAEFLPGRNLACHLLYDAGALIKVATYERLEYFMGRTVISGVTGNISRGALVNSPDAEEAADRAVRAICAATGETMTGLVAVDLRGDATGRAMVTEINLRHVAATWAFASAGHNMVEAQILTALGRADEVGPITATFPPGNAILRDIDGEPVWVAEPIGPAVGDAFPAL
jgi:hypothetical protein